MSAVLLPNKSTNVRTNINWKLRAQLNVLRWLSWIPTSGAVRRAMQLFCTPLPGTRQRALRADPGAAQLVQVQAGPDRLQAYVYGDPATQPYILLSHGWSSFGLRFQGWIAQLRDAGFAVVSFDHRAHGRSEGTQVSLPGFVTGVLAIGRHFGPAYAGIGHSLGGGALAQAAVRGLQVERLLLLAPAAEGEAALERFIRTLRLGDGMLSPLIKRFEEVIGEPMADYRAEAAAPRLRVPMLVIHDVADVEVPWSEGERYALKTPGARMLTVTGLGHHRVVDAPEVVQAGMAFLRGAVVGEHLQAAGSLGTRLC